MDDENQDNKSFEQSWNCFPQDKEYFENQDYMSFEESYNCFPVSLIKDKEYLEDGNRIIMPPSALERIANMEIEYPMVFEIKKSTTTTITTTTTGRCDNDHGSSRHVSHCGVLEFSADEGFVYVPEWLMKNLQLHSGSVVVLKYVNLAKGTFTKIQPHKTSFIKLPGPREILETALKNFACVTAGDTIMITHQNNRYFIDILETNPSNAISLVETDCEVDFVPPLDYKEPDKEPQKVQEKQTPAKDDQQPKFRAFMGVARRLDGQLVRSVHPAPVPPSSLPVRDTNNVKASEAQPLSRQRVVKLVFGPEEVDNPPSNLRRTSEEVYNKEKAPNVEEKKFLPFTGKKYTLGG